MSTGGAEGGRAPARGTQALRAHRARAAAVATAGLLASLVASMVATSAFARDGDPPPRSRIEDVLVTRAQQAAVDRALKWIAEHQQPGGFWGEERGTRVADTALSVLALMASGSTVTAGAPLPGGGTGPETLRGPYATHVRAGLQYLARLSWSDASVRLAPGYLAGDAESKMHGHGFALLALAEACGNLGPADLRSIKAFVAQGRSPGELRLADQVLYAVERGVRCTEAAQDPETGGWLYSPHPDGHEGSMTVTQIAALRAASDAGVGVNGIVMKRAYDYLRRSQNTANPELHGGFAYRTSEMSRVSYGLTAAALTTLFGLGRYGQDPKDKELIDRGFSYMDRNLAEATDPERGGRQFFYYRLFYGAQALYLSGDVRRIENQWPRLRQGILAQQQKDGSFRDLMTSEAGGVECCTAMACLTLQVPMETLPSFQRR